jgi:hypothetical protein
MSTRARNVTASLDDTKRYRAEMEFTYRGKVYVYSDRLFLMAKTAYDEARENNTDETIVLVDKDLGKRKLTLTVIQLKTLVQKCYRTARRMEVARTKVDEVEE